MNSDLIRAIRGPILLITLGTLLAVDHFGPVGFGRTWPILIIVFGLMKLLERGGAQSQVAAGQPAPPATPGGNVP